ncbi:MAG: tryptophan--tRNA ligase [Gammaproteobacteria bacterium]|nr:tryptophan--tRNA ligase [Gammaproteobacteria bacterium]
MMTDFSSQQRILSGMRVSGKMHLGHYHGVIKNWLKLQHEYECFIFAADWHGLTTQYDNPENIEKNTWDMIIDWLAAGVNPNLSHLFIQSWVPEHAELHLLLSMSTPLSWLERVPTYKDQMQKLKEKDLHTYGFLGYPVLMSADILLYRAGLVPIGEDQLPHLELTREIARRFNYFYGRESNFVEKAEQAIKKMGKKNARLFRDLLKRYQEQGDHEAIAIGTALLESQASLRFSERELLLGYLDGSGKIILPEPEALLTEIPKVPGLDGEKMSKSYNNTITLREAPEDVEKKIKTMQTDPARVRRTDPGEPDKCPVWALHNIYSTDDVKDWVRQGCRSASIGCLDCKSPLIDAIQKELAPIRERAQEFIDSPNLVKNIVAEGTEKAREVARETMVKVKKAMGLHYR